MGVCEFPGLSSFPQGLSHACPNHCHQPSQSPCTLDSQAAWPSATSSQEPRGLPFPTAISPPSRTQLSEAPPVPASTPMEVPSRNQREIGPGMVSLQRNRHFLALDDREERAFCSQGPAHTVRDWPKIATESWWGGGGDSLMPGCPQLSKPLPPRWRRNRDRRCRATTASST